ncbi:Na+/H+ antiporter NhaC family protein [Virgibacillus dokdonensis]|uniref:Malate-2H(+)/Na(+)-lactate antiporter n=1 Tax=Virgibacillus dokdonensis TaxID=302167 RepID=A0A2K9J2Y8_9BACI|nr:Na+/H+ antiporter NhaC family protein [Virgibacillus dokdonensis]AUJ25403.1 Malate-2H(+)/Na(+)-lactate antiporter [Virgibacillus dokdonensis]
MEETIWALIPPVMAIIMVLLTKRVLLSLGIGIITAGLFLAEFRLGSTLQFIWEAFKVVFVVDGALNTWNIFILLFVLMLGMLTALVTMMGGTRSFATWMIRKVKTRAGAQLMTVLFGIIIFVDDYFNSLTVGQIAKPVTDKQRISRAKLAYLVDSTSAPISVVAPISSWGAYIIGIIGTLLATHHITEYGAFQAFLQMIPMNYYVWAALGVVIWIAMKQVDFGPMKVHEQRAIKTGEVLSPERKEQIDVDAKLFVSELSQKRDLVFPMITLFLATLIAIYVNGLRNVEGEKTWMNILGSADVSFALFVGGVIGMGITMILFYQHIRTGKLSLKNFIIGAATGGKSMMPGFSILIFAWAIATLIDQLGTGVYLASVVEATHVSFDLLPFVVFLMAGFIAFSTGTSWGSFGILLPIAAEIAVATDVTLFLPMLAAVLAGAVFGDHCSPISDTTILSATGSSCHHIDHVTTQIPYALVAAGIAGIGYITFGFTGNVWLGLGLVILINLSLFITVRRNKVI